MQRFWIVGLMAVLIGGLLWPTPVLAASLSPGAGGSTAIAQLPTAASEAPGAEAKATATADGSTIDAAALFEQTCAGCHSGGGNIIRRGKNLKAKALKRYGMDNHEAIANIITNGKGIMSAYGEAAENGAPTRLTAPEIEALADYVLAQAAVDWK